MGVGWAEIEDGRTISGHWQAQPVGYSDIPLVGAMHITCDAYGRNYDFVSLRRLDYRDAAGEVRSYTLYFPMHRNFALYIAVMMALDT